MLTRERIVDFGDSLLESYCARYAELMTSVPVFVKPPLEHGHQVGIKLPAGS